MKRGTVRGGPAGGSGGGGVCGKVQCVRRTAHYFLRKVLRTIEQPDIRGKAEYTP